MKNAVFFVFMKCLICIWSIALLRIFVVTLKKEGLIYRNKEIDIAMYNKTT